MPLSPPLRVEDFAGIFLFSTIVIAVYAITMTAQSQCPFGHFSFLNNLVLWRTKMAKKRSQCPFPLRYASRTSRAFFFSQPSCIVRHTIARRHNCRNAPFPSATRRGLRGHFSFLNEGRGSNAQERTMGRNAPSGIFLFSTQILI